MMEHPEQPQHKPYTYLDLAKAVDYLIATYGLQQAVTQLRIITKPDLQQEKVLLALRCYCIALAVTAFELDSDVFYTENTMAYRDARMVCFHLLKTKTGLSFSGLGTWLKQTKRTVQYQCSRCTKLLETPINNREERIKQVYEQMDKQLTRFLSKIH